jgi:protocatechuate 3,4-dioxygenase beta subunit
MKKVSDWAEGELPHGAALKQRQGEQSRRRFVLDALSITGLALTGCGSSTVAGSGGAGGSSGGACTLYPQQTQGPYYVDADLLRADVTEGVPGAPLLLEVQVVRAGACTAIEGIALDIWQCDAVGVYSGYAGQLGGVDTTGRRFLRGTQLTDAGGRVAFRTIYPGWYPGRTAHVHFKVHLSATSEVTSQIYFPEDVTALVYGAAPYSGRGQKDTSNAADFIARSGGGMPGLPSITGSLAQYTAKLVVSVAG